MVNSKRRSIDPATFFLIAGLIVGLWYCVTVPYGAGFDEERHLARIYFMSEYHFLPNFPNPIMYEEVADLSYQRRLVQSPAFDMFSKETFFKTFDRAEENIRYGVKTQSIYSPVIFLPQAIIGRALWWKYDFPVLPTILLMKVAGMLIYLAGAYFAIRVVPYGKWIFAALALSPAAMYQAATLNADGFNTAVSFAFIGWVLSVYVNEVSGIRPRSVWVLVLLAILVGTAKPGAIVLLPLLLILIKHPFPSKKWILLLGIGVLVALAANIGWWSLASQGSTFSEGGAQSVSRQSSLILSDPIGFIKPLVQGLILTFPNQVQGWIASFGYWAGTVPEPVYFFYLVFVLAAFLAEEKKVSIPSWVRIFLAVFFLVCCAVIYSIAFAANYATGGVLALAKHGRYFIPFGPLLFLSVAAMFTVRENLRRVMKQAAIISFLLVVIYYSFGIYTAYYTYCGYETYTGGKCALPVYKNLEKEGAPEAVINKDTLISQTFTKFCGELESVDVFVNSVPEGSDGKLKFTLLGDEKQVLASKDFPAREITPYNYLEFPINLPTGYQGDQFEIQLEATDLSRTEEFSVTLTKSDYYPGQMTVDGTEGWGDLLIHYTCTGP